MTSEELDRDIDEWLDRAAAEYGKAELLPGFETRIIAKLNNRLAEKKWYFRWLPAAAAATIILSFSVYWLHIRIEDRRATEISSEMSTEREAQPTQKAELASKPPGRLDSSQSNESILEESTKESVRQHYSRKVREAQEGHFLSSGLSDQERYLIAFVRATSQETIQDIPDTTSFDPLEIDPLQIEELQIPEFHIQDFGVSSFEIEASSPTTQISEEIL